MFCFRCGSDITETDKVCPSCGAPVSSAPALDEPGTAAQTATFSARVVAFLIDLAVLVGIYFLLSMFTATLTPYLTAVAACIYFVYYWTKAGGATVGMRSRGLRVADHKTGRCIDLVHAILRLLVMLVSIAGAFLGCLMMFFNRSGRMLHDFASGSEVVVRGEQQ